ncbi:hypothetical protein [Palleronia caenipelagi]|uniref:Uncharacterized protein n=1 Tax=Palleronia caenipelagi TaxID=2489174 RepID=A0A547PXZ0_9RHOB|nr:hypothetical protein [Palleronia caenipelagi]TRD19013.1 hypothetical protein FEV53_10970 [Palleronia caenipelagi]
MSHPTPKRIVLIVGSGPDAARCQNWARGPFSRIVAVNNAWRLRGDWDDHIAPDDFPAENAPQTLTHGQRRIGSDTYVPANNAYGGVFYAGGTMAFTAGYWALHALKPDVMAFIGCDMVYPTTGKTHFYGKGTADPLRRDPSLRNLEAKSARLRLIAAGKGCACVRLSSGESRLLFPSATPDDLPWLSKPNRTVPGLAEIRAAEDRLGYAVPSGRYWTEADRFDPCETDALDQRWLSALQDWSRLTGDGMALSA